MSHWKGPFEELYHKALQDGANDISEQAKLILADAGLDSHQTTILAERFKEMAETVQERHAYDRSMLYNLPSPSRKSQTGPWRT